MQNQKVGNKNIQCLEELRRNEQGVQKNQKVGQKVGKGIIQPRNMVTGEKGQNWQQGRTSKIILNVENTFLTSNRK